MKAIAMTLVLLVSASANAIDLEFEGAVCEAIGAVTYSQEVAIQDEEMPESFVEVASRSSDHIQ